MSTAVLRVRVDADGRLSPDEYHGAVRELESAGYELVVPQRDLLPPRDRELEFIVHSCDDPGQYERIVATCKRTFGTQVALGQVTYISRGTDDDARGVLDRFGVGGEVRRESIDGEDLVIVTIGRDDAARVPESRLHTALEAALNVEVQVVTA